MFGLPLEAAIEEAHRAAADAEHAKTAAAVAAAGEDVELFAKTKIRLAANDGRFRHGDRVVFIRADDVEVSVDLAVVRHRVVTVAQSGEDAVGDDCGLGDCDDVVAVAAIVHHRAIDRAGDRHHIVAVAEGELQIAFDLGCGVDDHLVVAFAPFDGKPTDGAADLDGIVDEIVAELINNRVDTEELKERLERDISEPLKEISGELLPEFEKRLETLEQAYQAGPTEATESLATAKSSAQTVEEAMKAVLDRMLELEEYNELVELLRGIVKDQEQLKERTQQEQREKLKGLLED